MSRILLYLFVMVLFACRPQTKETESENSAPKGQRPSALKNGKFIYGPNQKLLYGGEDSTWHFNITNSLLVDSQYHYGIGREQFDALVDPQFMTEAEAAAIYEDDARFLVFSSGDESRAYGIDLLTKHEVVNDVVNGEPVAAAYCILADLGAMYSREVGGKTLTFALSGYTYYDPEVWEGLDGFVWWDRETESTWWPLIGKGVSGDLIDVPLKVYNENKWDQTTWKNIKGKYANLKVLKPGQTMEPPENWTRFDPETIINIRNNENTPAIEPPKWGENSR